MPHTTPGHYLSTELIDAKRSGRNFQQPDLAAFIDVNLEAWCQANGYQLVKASQTAIPLAFKAEKVRSIIPPAPADVTAYFQSIGYPVSGEEFCDCYQQKGWLVGKAKMKDWQSACRNWKRNSWGKPTSAPTATTAKDYSRL